MESSIMKVKKEFGQLQDSQIFLQFVCLHCKSMLVDCNSCGVHQMTEVNNLAMRDCEYVYRKLV